LFHGILKKLNGPTRLNDLQRNHNNEECTVSLVNGLVPPGSPRVPHQEYVCTTDEGDAIFFDGDPSTLLGAGFVTGETRIALAPQAMSTDGKIRFVTGETRIALASQAISTDGEISVQQAMKAPGSSRNIYKGNRRRKLTTTGTKKVLVILVTNGVDKPSQSEQDMYNDVFQDDNNLVSTVSVAIR